MTQTKTESELIVAAFTSCRTNKVPMTNETYTVFKDGYKEKEEEVTLEYCINYIIKVLENNRDRAIKFRDNDVNGRAMAMYLDAIKFIDQI